MEPVRRLASMLVMAALAVGCGTRQPRPADLNPGPRPSNEQAEAAIKEYLARALKDPDSLKQFRVMRLSPREWQNDRWSPWYAGWLACYEFNAKNSYGAYGGLKPAGAVLSSRGSEIFILYVLPDILVSSWC